MIAEALNFDVLRRTEFCAGPDESTVRTVSVIEDVTYPRSSRVRVKLYYFITMMSDLRAH